MRQLTTHLLDSLLGELTSEKEDYIYIRQHHIDNTTIYSSTIL